MKFIKSKIVCMATFLMVATCAFADTAQKYISPNNDGVKDTLDIPMQIKDKRYVVSWALIITDENGQVVRTITNKRKTEVSGWRGLVKNLLSAKSGVDIPAVVTWNGFLGDEAESAGLTSGTVAPDGVYYYQVRASDDNGNTSGTGKYKVIVDTTPPLAAIQPLADSEKIFGEGSKPTIKIVQSGSVENLWVGRILDSQGKVVRTYEWKNSAPQAFEWNGVDDNGSIVEDGAYSYEVTSTDLAGNTADKTFISNIIFSAEKPSLSVIINGSKYCSPNGDGKNDTINFSLIIPSPRTRSNSLSGWKLSVVGANDNKVYYERSGTNDPISSFIYDGTSTDGTVLKDGEYRLCVSARYANGYEPTPAYSARFVLHSKAPAALVKSSAHAFNGTKPLVIAQRQTSLEEEYTGQKMWAGAIKDSDGKVVKSFDFGPTLPESVSWDGSNMLGAFAGDGVYHYELSVEDLAGNTNTISSEPFMLDTSETELRMTVSSEYFSPNGDNVQDSITIRPIANAVSGIKSYSIFVLDADGNAVRKFVGASSLPSSVEWNGRGDDGSLCRDGEYEIYFSTVALSGTTSESHRLHVVLDTEAPSISITSPYKTFSPDGLPLSQSKKQTLPVNVTSCSAESKWTISVLDRAGNAVKTIVKQSSGLEGIKVQDFSWDGTDDNGNLSPNGTYSIEVSSVDESGNKGSARLSDIVLDNREAKAYITTSELDMAPNGDGYKDTQTFTIRSTLAEGISSWSFDVVDSTGKSVKNWNHETSGALPQSIVWDGKTTSGISAEGQFTGRLHIEYAKGNVVDASSPSFVCSTTAPVLSVISSADSSKGLYFSPDNDGNEDELNMKLMCHTLSGVKSWTLTVKNCRSDTVFWKISGKSMQSADKNANSYYASIVWDGRGNNGEYVMSAEDYPYEYTVVDNLGMTSTYTGIIPVDVLVILEDGYLKMQVPSIVFRGDHADFKLTGEVDDDGSIIERSSMTAEQKANNERVLTRIAQILRKFNNYNVTVVGHANPVNYNPKNTKDGEWNRELKELSLERATYVKNWLIKEGRISSGRLSAEGKGGLEIIANPNDMDNRWKNRRVEFILHK